MASEVTKKVLRGALMQARLHLDNRRVFLEEKRGEVAKEELYVSKLEREYDALCADCAEITGDKAEG